MPFIDNNVPKGSEFKQNTVMFPHCPEAIGDILSEHFRLICEGLHSYGDHEECFLDVRGLLLSPFITNRLL